MPRAKYGVPLDLYADDPELDPLKGSPLEPEAQPEPGMAFDLPELKRMQYAALDSIAKPAAADELEPVALPAAKPATGGSGPVVSYRPQPGPAPKGYGAELGRDALARSQLQDNARNAARDTSDALYATFARKPMPRQRDTSDAANVMQQRAGLDQEEALMGRQRSAALNAERADPASETSANFRAFLRGVDPETAKAIGPYLDRMSYAELGERMPYLKELFAKRQAKEAAALRLKAEQEAKAGERRYQLERDARQNAAARERALILSRQRGDAADDKAEEKSDKKVQELEKRMPTEVVTLKSKLEKLDKLINFSDEANEEDVPGVGGIVGRLPDFLVSDKGGEVRQYARGIMGALIKMQSGTAASEGEVDRKMGELGMGPGSTEKQFRQGLRNLRAEAAGVLKQNASGFDPSTVKTYRQRGGLTAEDMQPKPPVSAPPFPGAVRVQAEDGRMGWVDPSEPLPEGVRVVQ